MKRFVWVTRGTSESDMVVAKAVLVYAEDLDQAIIKVVREMEYPFPEAMTTWGDEWFVQEVGSEEIK